MKLNKFFFASIITFIILCFSSCDLLNPPQEEEVVTVESISVGSEPYKNTYDITAQEVFNSNGLIINVAYSDGTIKESKKYTLSLEDGTFIYNGFKFEKKYVGQLKIIVKFKEGEQDFETSFYLTIEETVLNPQNPGDNTQDNPQDNTQDNTQEQDPYEGVPPEKQVKDIVVHAEPKKYAEGESLNLEEMDVLVQRGTGYWNYIEDYTISIVNKTTGQVLSSTKKLPLGEYTVVIIYDDGIKVWKTDYSITVTKPYDIDEFSYSTNNGKATIGGFKGKKTTQTETHEEETYDFDAPYETVYSQPEDFEYEFINGSETDIRITSIKPERRYLITDLTIPAKIGDYNVKEVSCDIALYEGEDDFKFGLNVRNLIIEEGVEGLVEGTVFWSWEKYQQFFDWVSPYLKKLVLPKGFSLKMKQFNYGTYDNYYFYIRGDQLEDLTLPSDLTVIKFGIACKKLQKLILPESVTEIEGELSLQGIKTEWRVPESVTEIKGGLWLNCQKITFPATLKKISCAISLPEAKEIVFEGETELAGGFEGGLYIPKIEELTVTGTINAKVFDSRGYDDVSLKKIIFKKNAQVQSGYYFSSNAFSSNNLEELVIDRPDAQEVLIGGFSDCQNLKKITINTSSNAKIKVDNDAFKNCTSLETIEWSSPYVSFGENSFAGCTNLRQMTFPNTETVTYERVSETELRNPWSGGGILHEGSFEIGPYAFYKTAIKEFTFQSGILYKLYENAFAGCSLENLTFEDGCSVISEDGGHSLDAVVDPRYIVSVGVYDYIIDTCADVFDANNIIKEIDISKAHYVSVNFNNFTALTTLCVGNSAYLLGELNNCENLKTISLGSQGLFIPGAMRNCVKLEEIYYRGPDSTYYSFEREPFTGCSALKKITMDSCYISSYFMGKEGFDIPFELKLINCEYYDYAFYKCSGLTKVTGEIKNPPVGIFAGCNNLKEISFTGKVGREAFKDCTSLEKVIYTLYDSHSGIIEAESLSNCINLKTVLIEDDEEEDSDYDNSLTFGAHCFYNCNNITTFNISDSIETIVFENNSFDGNDNILKLIKNRLQDITDEQWVLAFPNTSAVIDSLNLIYNFVNISGLGIKNLIIPIPVYKEVRYREYSEWVIANVYDHGYSLIPAGFAENNKYLETVVLDSDIEARAFKGCSSLTTVTIGDTTFHVAKPDSFENCPKLKKIIVPQEYYEQYKTSPRWKNYWDLICTE